MAFHRIMLTRYVNVNKNIYITKSLVVVEQPLQEVSVSRRLGSGLGHKGAWVDRKCQTNVGAILSQRVLGCMFRCIVSQLWVQYNDDTMFQSNHLLHKCMNVPYKTLQLIRYSAHYQNIPYNINRFNSQSSHMKFK